MNAAIGNGIESKLRVLVVHNAYQQRGGEDSVVESETELLRGRGHEVAFYSRHNNDIANMPRLRLAGQTLWSARSECDIRQLIGESRPDVIHVHNTFPLISPSLYWAASRAGIPVVQTLHNFRLLCPQAMLLRDDKVCEDCVGKLPWRGVVRACYRESKAQSATLAGMLILHRAMGTYNNKVTRYIALSEFSRAKFIEGGLPAARISVKPNFVDAPPTKSIQSRVGALFVGRLSSEKGVDVLVEAMHRLPQFTLDVVGSGPLEPKLSQHTFARCHGWLPRNEILEKMNSANYLVMPSICYETFGMVAIEAFACGLPVIASRLGAMADLIEEEKTGLLFEPGSANDLAKKMAWANDNPTAMLRMGKCARLEYEAKYTADRNYDQLMAIYDEAVSHVPIKNAQ